MRSATDTASAEREKGEPPPASRRARSLYALDAAGMPTDLLEDYTSRLQGALQAGGLDPATIDIARMQAAVIAGERVRRRDFAAIRPGGDSEGVSRAGLVASVMQFERSLAGPDPQVAERFHSVVRIAVDATQNARPGSPVVAAALRGVCDETHTPQRGALVSWVNAALALDVLARGEDGVAGASVATDAVTRAQAVRAKRLLYGASREADAWLDLDALTVARMLDDAGQAIERWHQDDLPAQDLARYLSPIAGEEPGRPPPHSQVVWARTARLRVEAAGGAPYPLIIPWTDGARRGARRMWSEGLPGVPAGDLGLRLYPAAGDARARWGAPPHPIGAFVALAIHPDAMLHVHHAEHAEDERVLDRLVGRATEAATDEGEYVPALRRMLLDAGYHAVARFDHSDPDVPLPREIEVLDTRFAGAMLVRESIPSFSPDDTSTGAPDAAPTPP